MTRDDLQGGRRCSIPDGIHDGDHGSGHRPLRFDRPGPLGWRVTPLAGGAISSAGPDREEAAERLHALLLRAARFEVARRHDRPCHRA